MTAELSLTRKADFEKVSDNIYATSISDLYVVARPVFEDDRGFFHEIMRYDEIKDVTGVDFGIRQVSHARSKPGVIRAIHCEDWDKLVYPVSGQMFAAIADVRPDSISFMRVETFYFDDLHPDSEHLALLLPPGIGNSVCVLGDRNLDYVYVVPQYWDNSKARGIAWDDPDLNIQWPINEPRISDRDRQNPRLRDLYPDKFNG